MLIVGLLSVVVTNLDVVSVPINETETDAPLVVDRDRVLTPPSSSEGAQPVAGWHLQGVDPGCEINVLKSADCAAADADTRNPDAPPAVTAKPRVGETSAGQPV
jgi:hypothetical protein